MHNELLRFESSPANKERDSYHDAVRENFRSHAEWILKYIPEGRERSISLERLEEAMMWCNKGIANADKEGRWHG